MDLEAEQDLDMAREKEPSPQWLNSGLNEVPPMNRPQGKRFNVGDMKSRMVARDAAKAAQETRFFTPSAVAGQSQRNAQGIPVGQPAAQQAGFRERNIMQPAGQNVTNLAGFANSAHRKVAEMRAARGGSAFGNSLEGSGSRPARRGSAFRTRSLTKRDEFGNKLSDLKDMDPMERAQLLESNYRTKFAQTKEERDAEAASLQNIRALQQISESPARERRAEEDLRSKLTNREDRFFFDKDRTETAKGTREDRQDHYAWLQEEAQRKDEEGDTREATRIRENAEKLDREGKKEDLKFHRSETATDNRARRYADAMGLPYLSEANIASIKKHVAGNEKALDKIVRKHGFDDGELAESQYLSLLQMTEEEVAADPEYIEKKKFYKNLGFNFKEMKDSAPLLAEPEDE